jgi:HlyD family secretion protein
MPRAALPALPALPAGAPGSARASQPLAAWRRAVARVARHWAVGLALLLAAVAAWGLGRWWLGPQVAVDRVVQRDFVQSVVASGHVEAPHRVEVGALITATVVRVPVAEGQTVQAGQTLVELDDAELRATEQQAVMAVAQAQARLRQLQEVQLPQATLALHHAEVTAALARLQMQRSETLFGQGFIGAAALDEVYKATDLAELQRASAVLPLQSVQAQGSDHALATAALAQARAALAVARARSRHARVVAPQAGTLIGRAVEAGDVVQPGKTLMTLSPTGRTQLVVALDEKHLRLLARGQRALASADAYPQQRFEAVVAYIHPGVNAQTGSVTVKLDVATPPPVLRQDMTVSVDIEVARRPAARLVPLGAVHDAEAATPWVLRLEAGQARRRPVRLGLCGGGWCEVLDGLAPGDTVLPVTTAVADGARVRARPSAAASPGGV